MRRLLLADVHANLPAFRAVLADAGSVDQILFLGDVVGFGPHPAECVELLRSLGAVAILGNHDGTASARRAVDGRSHRPGDWEDWTAGQLGPEHFDFLASLPARVAFECCGERATAIHHPTGAPYLHPAMPDDALMGYFAGQPAGTIFCAHSHRWIDRRIGERWIVCLPAVGQPRDGDPRAGYVLEEAGRLRVVRVSYDVDAVVRDVERLPLDPEFRERWVRFLRTGFDAEWSRPMGGR